jgi:hypothetical protein
VPKPSTRAARSSNKKDPRRPEGTIKGSGQQRANRHAAQNKPQHKFKEKIFSLPGLVASAVLTAAVGWAVDYVATVAAAPDAPPVSVAVMADPAKIPFLNDFPQNAVLASSKDRGSPGQGCNGFHSWLLRNGGVPIGAQFQLVIQSDTTKAVLVEDMRVLILRKLPRLNGPAVSCPSAGEVDFRPININLDSSPPKVSYKINNKSAPFGFTLSEGQTEVFEVTASGQEAHYIFDIQLDLVIGGHSQTLTVTDNGQPFEASGTKATEEWAWNYGNAWDLYSGRDSDLKEELLGGQPFPPGT